MIRLFHSSSPLSQPERSYNLTNGGMSFLRNRFTSSTPLHNTRSAVPATDNLVSGRSGANADNLSPSLRKAINTRRDEFGSLGEALSSMPLNSHKNAAMNGRNGSIVTQATPNNARIAAQAQTKPAANGVRRNLNAANFNLSSSTASCSFLDASKLTSSGFVSKTIIVLAAVFLLVIGVKYFNLRPTPDGIQGRFPVCGKKSLGNSKGFGDGIDPCVQFEHKDELIGLFKVRFTENRHSLSSYDRKMCCSFEVSGPSCTLME